MSEGKADEQQGFVSKLAEGRERFLAHVVEHTLEIGQRTPEDFIRHFPPAAIMAGLREQPLLRSQILVLTTGVKQKIALRKSATSAGEDLQIALDEGETDAESIVALLSPDDRIRYLDHKKLWAYCIEGDFWTVQPTKKHEFERAKDHIAFMLERGLVDKLITHRDIVEGISVEEFATRLPRSELGKLLKQALENSHTKAIFTEVDLLAALPPSELVKHIPLPHIWEAAVVPKIARTHRYVDPPQPVAVPDWPEPERPAVARPLGASAATPAEKTADKPAEKPAEKSVEKPLAATRTGLLGEKLPEPAPLPERRETEPPEADVEVTDEDIRIG
jgi:hypothetical protein